MDGTYKPQVCPSGTVRSLRDSITCKNCPKGTWNPFRGLTDESLCIPCNPGYVCSAEGTENNKPFGDNVEQVPNEFILPCEAGLDSCITIELQPLGGASLCPEGYVCDARTEVAFVKCPDGYFCGYGTSPETQFVNKCPMGYFSSRRHRSVREVSVPLRRVSLLPRRDRHHHAAFALKGRNLSRTRRTSTSVSRTGSRSGASSRSNNGSSTKRTRFFCRTAR